MHRLRRPVIAIAAALGASAALPAFGQSAFEPLRDPASPLLSFVDRVVQLPGGDLQLRAALPTTPANDKAAQLSYLGIRLQDAHHLQRFGHGWARYSMDGLDASWFRFGSDVGIALQRHTLVLPGGVDIDTGLAALRIAQPGVGGATVYQKVLMPAMSVDLKSSLRMNLMLAPSMAGHPATAFGAFSYTF